MSVTSLRHWCQLPASDTDVSYRPQTLMSVTSLRHWCQSPASDTDVSHQPQTLMSVTSLRHWCQLPASGTDVSYQPQALMSVTSLRHWSLRKEKWQQHFWRLYQWVSARKMLLLCIGNGVTPFVLMTSWCGNIYYITGYLWGQVPNDQAFKSLYLSLLLLWTIHEQTVKLPMNWDAMIVEVWVSLMGFR